MKTTGINFRKLFYLLLLFSAVGIYAQQISNTQAYPLGTISQFLNQIQYASLSKDKAVHLYTSETDSLGGKINYKKNKPDMIFLEGEVTGKYDGTFTIEIKQNKLTGNIILPKAEKAYQYFSDYKGNVFIKETDINTILCIGYHGLSDSLKKKKNTPRNSLQKSNISNLQSFPGANGCLLLDFDGYYLPPGSGWNSGIELYSDSAGMNSKEIQEAWEIVSEDFRPFNLNITTDESVFNSYPLNKRMRCVITSTNTVAPGFGGIAYIGDFSQYLDRPCWVFTSGVGTSGKFVGETLSHEFGHTMGLSHDGSYTESYYSGHGEWAPIMGLSYYKKITQWSKGEYPYANNTQDDLNIISGVPNNIGYRTDDHGNTITNATSLAITGGEVSTESAQNQGIIEQTGDIDMFSFTTSGGQLTIYVKTIPKNSNLRLQVTLYNDQGTAMLSYDASTISLDTPVTINTPLSSGKYYLSVTGISDGISNNNYSHYSSLGAYNISGTIPSNPVCVGGTVQLTANVSGTSYQWQYLHNSNWYNYPEANVPGYANFSGTGTPILTITNISTQYITNPDYARLVAYDSNGHSTASNPIIWQAVNCPGYSQLAIKEAADQKVYPNPVLDKLDIHLGSAKENHQIKVTNPLGQILYEAKTSEKILTISFSDKPAGTYLVNVKNSANGTIKFFKILKK